MSIQIDQINVQNLGPISEFRYPLGRVNLIYGQNEKGKTFLVEFVLQSLFKNRKSFSFRDSLGNGNLTVSGIEGETIEFSPETSSKLEDLWADSNNTLPSNICQLLVVKGAELDFDKSSAGGICKDSVRAFLSNERTLEAVQSSIQLTVRKANLEDREIVGEHRGQIKERESVMKRLSELDAYLNKVDQELSGSRRSELKEKAARLEDAIGDGSYSQEK